MRCSSHHNSRSSTGPLSRNVRFLRLYVRPVFEVKILNQVYTEGNSEFTQVFIQFIGGLISFMNVDRGDETPSSQMYVD